MQVRAGRIAGRTNITNVLTGLYGLPGSNAGGADHVAVNSCKVITAVLTVVNHNPVAVTAAVKTCSNYNAVGCCYNGLAVNAGTGNIYAAVQTAPTRTKVRG